MRPVRGPLPGTSEGQGPVALWSGCRSTLWTAQPPNLTRK